MNRVFLFIGLLAVIVGVAVVHFSLVRAAPGNSPLAVHGGPEGEHTPTPTPTPTSTPPPSASLSPNRGPVGTGVTVNGSWFSSGTVVVTFDSQQVATANPGFNGSISTSFNVPALSAGRYTVQIGNQPKTFTITSSFSVSPTSGRPGTSITVRGDGFAPNSQVSITFDDREITTTSADGNGRILETVEVPPGTAGGDHKIAASGPSSTDRATFSVTATLSLDRGEASPGDTVTVSGTGFRANETGISIKFDGQTRKSGISADSRGTWSESFEVPNATAGSHRIQASGTLTALSSVPQVSLILGAGLRLERTSGPPGTTVRVNGSGARSGERITVKVGNNLDRTFEAVASRSGVWSADITIPPAPGGLLSIKASGSTSQATETSFTIWTV